MGSTRSGAASSKSRRSHRSGSRGSHHETPLPVKQLAILAVIALAEQTALNSISPYLPEMVGSFPGVRTGDIGLYVGLIASAFALAQFATGFGWGWLSDRVGRKPIILTGTILTACCFVMFGFCKDLWQAVLVQAMMGLVNGNQGVISTCLGEITDRSNQGRAFTYLPVIYGLGGITGPVVGGLLVIRQNPFKPDEPNPYPYLLPNMFSAAILVIDFVLTSFFLEESLQCAKQLPPLSKRFGNLFAWLWQFTSSRNPTYVRRKKIDSDEARRGLISGSRNGSLQESHDDNDNEHAGLFADNAERINYKDVLTKDTILLLATFLIFQLSNVSFNSLYPIFAQASPPTGRDLTPEEIGISLGFAGIITIVFQVGIFGRMRENLGNKVTYRMSLGGFVIAFALIPFVGYKDGKGVPGAKGTTVGNILLWLELGAILIVKTIAAVGGLTSSLLLITNSAPSHAVLGTLNGLAQTLSAAGRAVGPFISGSLFTAATKIQPKGEALAFGIFGGIAFLGTLLSLGIHGANLEAEDWDEEHDDDDEERHAESHDLPERSGQST